MFHVLLDGNAERFDATVGVDDAKVRAADVMQSSGLAGHENYAGPGHWNDPDMLMVGIVGFGKTHPTRLCPDEQILKTMMGSYTRKNIAGLLEAALLGVLLLLTGTSVYAQSVGLRLMPLGDSITAGYRSSNGDGYRGPLWEELTKQGDTLDFVGSQRSGVMFDPDNEGYYGNRIDQIAGLINKELALYQPNLILLDIGVNDLGQNYQVSTAPARLASLIDQIVAADPKATVLVAQLICNSTPSVQTMINSYNSQIPGIVQARASAGKRVYMVSMSALTLADLKDGLHPNDGGYQKMADAWDAGIKRVIAAGKITPIEFAGKFEIRCVGSGLALDVSAGSNANDAAIIQWPYGTSSNQLWNFIPTDSGYYQIKNAYSGLDLNVTGASTASGAKIVQWQFGSQKNDQWLPVKNADGSYVFRNRSSGLLLDDPGGKTQGAQMDQQGADGGTSQRFNLIAK